MLRHPPPPAPRVRYSSPPPRPALPAPPEQLRGVELLQRHARLKCAAVALVLMAVVLVRAAVAVLVLDEAVALVLVLEEGAPRPVQRS